MDRDKLELTGFLSWLEGDVGGPEEIDRILAPQLHLNDSPITLKWVGHGDFPRFGKVTTRRRTRRRAVQEVG